MVRRPRSYRVNDAEAALLSEVLAALKTDHAVAERVRSVLHGVTQPQVEPGLLERIQALETWKAETAARFNDAFPLPSAGKKSQTKAKAVIDLPPLFGTRDLFSGQ